MNLNERNTKGLCKLLERCSNLKGIILNGNKKVGSSEHEIFINLIKSSSSLESIILQDMTLSEENINQLSELFGCCSNLKVINLSENEKVGFLKHEIFNSLINSSSLKKMYLNGISLNERNAIELSKLFGYCSNLKSIELGGNEIIGSTEHGIFENLIKSSSSLENIDLWKVDLNERNAKEFSKLLNHCSNLKSIELSYNKTVGYSEHGIFNNLTKSSLTFVISI